VGLEAAAWLESLATCDYPSWGYSYQEHQSGSQSVWQIERSDVTQIVRIGGRLLINYEEQIQKVQWVEWEELKAVGIDVPTSGYNTFTINCLRQWKWNKPLDGVCKVYFYVSATI